MSSRISSSAAEKRAQPDLRDDVVPLLRPGLAWDFDAAMDVVLQSLVARLPGEPWKGEAPA